MSRGVKDWHCLRIHQHCLYVLEMSNGIVKVGRTASPRFRMRSLIKQCRVEFGADIHRIHFSNESNSLHANEQWLIECAAAEGVRVPGRREYFTGLSFDRMVGVLCAAPETVPA